MKISVILPTRKRFSSLQASVASLSKTSRSAELEFMLAIDDDDADTLSRLDVDPIVGAKLHVGPRLGYIRLHDYVNRLCNEATGDWFFLWNDDALLEKPGWDELIAPYQGQLVVVNPATNHAGHPRENCIFPIVPRQWVEILGHFSLSNHNDTYVEHIANALGIRRDVDIFLRHDRADLTGGNNDEVYAEREFTTGAFYGPENQANIRRDIDKLAQVLQGAPA